MASIAPLYPLQFSNSPHIYYSNRRVYLKLQYLENNIDKTYVDINQMADELQKKYREYAKRKRSAFRASVKKAYSIVLQSYGLEDKDSSDDELLSDDSDPESDGEDKFVRLLIWGLACFTVPVICRPTTR